MNFLKYFFQKLIRGYSDKEIRNLDITISKLVLPRLKAFKKFKRTQPGIISEEEWDQVLDDIIYSLDVISNDTFSKTKEEYIDWGKVDDGLELFGKYFRDLWW